MGLGSHEGARQRRLSLVGSLFLAAGACILLLAGGGYAYSRFEAWAASQPRHLASSRILWPEVPPTTPLAPSGASPLPASVPSPSPTPSAELHASPPVQIRIDRLGIKRSIVSLGRVGRGSKLDWDTDKLFAKSGRKDLVGHLEDSASPGERGNVVLLGHNYNRGAYNWTGVFHSIHRLKKGDVIVVVTASDKEYRYRVQHVEKVPRKQTIQHITRLGPSREERLTLATCGGANIAPFPAVTYVTAVRVPQGD